MVKSFTWRDLLAEIIADPSERHQLAAMLNVHPLTLTRWSTGISMPRFESLHRLMEALPAYKERLHSLLVQEIPEFARTDAFFAQKMAASIPSSLYTEILSLRATSSPLHRCRAISERLLSGLLEQLDAQQVGVMALLELCTPPSTGKPIRSLHIFVGRILPRSWEQKLQQAYPYLFGAESLAGYAVQTNRLQSLYNREMSDLPALSVIDMKSAVACPIRSFSRIAGCLYVASRQLDYFLTPQLQLIDAYAQLVTLALDDHHFYELDRIALSLFPSGQEQAPLVRAIQYQMAHKSGGRPNFPAPRTPQQIEQCFWQLVEQQLLDGDSGEVPSSIPSPL